jgi:transposase-like protein
VKAVRRKPGSTWHFDEMFATLRGDPYLLWRAVDEHGAEFDILLQKRRNKAAAKRFFKRVLRSSPAPRRIVTDQLHSYPAAKGEIPELANVKHVFVKAAARLNNRAENSHQPTRERKRRMRGFCNPKRTQKFLSLLRADTATFRAQAASATRFTLSKTTRSAIRHVARNRGTRPKSVDWFLNDRHPCRRFVSHSAS